MAVQPISQGAIPGAAGPIGGNQGMGRDDFLKLLIAQLQNQDPLHPLDNQEFAAQLATFNSLDQLIGINQKLDGVQLQQQFLGQLGAVSLIGKEIIAEGNQIVLASGTQPTISYSLGAPAARVVINIKDDKGNTVRTIQTGNQGAGNQTAVWDGKDSTGNALPAGVYSIEVTAFDAAGKSVAATTRTRGVVTGVSLDGGELLLEIGGIKIPLGAVRGIL
ncbi:MAG TPA: flagellar hook capping FlgD N-terminal domain-containing protein [Candidatus Binatia bacterium]|jgi:flagellar basal-body rod modification protein FlgD